jgi:hypothetical protein
MDTRIAVRWLRENAQLYGVDPDRIAAIGSSAGAFCALVAGVVDEPGFDFDRLTPGDPIPYPAQSSLAGVTVDLWGTLAGFTNFVVDGDDSPTMIAHGTADTVVPFTAAQALANRAAAVGLDHELWPLAGVGHGAPLSTDVSGGPLSQRILDFLASRLDLCACSGGESCGLDPFNCYRVRNLKNPRFERTDVALTDEFAVNDGTFTAVKPTYLCNPTSLDGVAVNNSDDHLTCYKIRGPALASSARPEIAVDDVFGSLELRVLKPRMLCVPSTKTVLP